MALLSQDDLMTTGGGLFGHRRAYASPPTASFLGPNGYNWYLSTLPLVTRIDPTTVAVTFDQNRIYWFYQYGSSYLPQYPWLNVTLTEDTTAELFTFTDTSNGRLQVTILNSLAVTTAPGGFVSYTDGNGIEMSVTSRTGTLINEVQRSYTIAGVLTVDSLLYGYFTSGLASGLLQSVTWRQQVGGGSWTPLRQCVYTYYGNSDPNGSLNDLRNASQQIPDGSGGWNTVAVNFYRYWLLGSSKGFAHALKMRIGPESYRQLFNASVNLFTATDAALLPYADEYFEYSPGGGQVTKESAAVCTSCAGGGTTSDLFAYSANPRSPAPGDNTWSNKTVQTLPDGSTLVVYTNYVGLPMLMINVDPSGANMWGTFYRFNSAGQVIWKAHPSAVALPASLSTLEAYDDLLNYNSGTGLYQYLNSSAGLIEISDYYTATNSSIGAAEGYLADRQVKQGQSGTPVMTQSLTYTSNTDADGNTIYPIAAQTSYPIAGDTTTKITTSFSYLFFTGTNVMSQKTTTLPAVSTAQNGSGTSDTAVEQYDPTGNRIQTTDERGIVNNYAFNALALMSQQVLNVQSGINRPGVNVTTDFMYDILGRPTLALGPSHTVVIAGTATTVRNATFTVYIQSVQPTSGTWAPDQVLTAQGYATGTGPSYTYTLIDPVSITNLDKDGRALDRITSKRTIGSGALSPTDTFAQTDWQTWTSIQYDIQHRTIGQRVYFLIPSTGAGTVGINFGQTTFGYDALERKNRNVAPGGTIERTVWTTPQWIASVWVGTNDTGATDSDPTGGGAAGNNMVMVTANQYDGGSAGGDGNLTEITRYVSATSGDVRVTGFAYDFRKRRTSMTDPTGRYFPVTIDNLDRITQAQGYSAVGGTLFAQKQTNFDDRSQTYQTLTFAVNVSTGAVGNALIGNTWRDPSGNILQSIGEGQGKFFTKQTFNGVNWVLSAYRGYNTSGTSYSQAGTVADDIIVEQTDNTFDEVGNTISAATSQRLNDASTSTTGALTSSLARVSYTANWFDGIDRTIASANYGAASSFARPSTPPSSSATVLVNQTGYDDAGRAYQSTDPMGIVNQTSFDNASRATSTVEDVGGLARTTNYTYTLDSLISTMTAVNSATGDQTTTWLYGTTLADCGVARNDLLKATIYPNDDLSWATLTADQWASLTADQWAALTAYPAGTTFVTYNRLGQKSTFTDQRGTARTFTFDKLGRLTDDGITTIGSNTDNSVLRISRAYEVRGMVSTITSADNATPGSGTILNQVGFIYNDFGQLITDNQEHSGAVSGSTPNVQYDYDDGSSSSNEIRLNLLTYPNDRPIAYDYGSSGGMSDYLNRVDAINDTSSGTTTLANYLYLGASTVIRISYPEPSIWLDLWGGTSGTFAGLDLFNRVIDQRWQNDITGTPTDIDRYKYGYDQNSNRIWKANVVGTAAVIAGLDEFYANDALNRLTNMQRGVLNGTQTGITGTPSVEQDWTLDPTGNWSNFLTKAAGTTDLDQTRTSNTVNEITNITEATGPTWIVPAYDGAGNTITMPQVVDPTQSFIAVYDAWNRMVSISAGATLVGAYQYDGRNFRIVKKTYTSGMLSETRQFYFTSNWQDIEEAVSGSMTEQYVWGIRYIDELVCRDDATPQRLYATQDASFNLTSITNTSGSVAERYVYGPYGERTVMNVSWTVVSASAYGLNTGFQGLPVDIESSAICSRQRYIYNAAFLTRNPIGYVDGASLYEYLGGDPVNCVDPTGMPLIKIGGGTQPPQRSPDLAGALPDDKSICSYRIRCHPFVAGRAHCGLEIYNGGSAMTLDSGTAPGTNVVTNIAGLDGIGPVGDQMPHWYSVLGFIGDYLLPGKSTGYLPAQFGVHSGYPTAGSANIFGPWTALPQDTCDCLLNRFNVMLFNIANINPYHASKTNSNWALKCYTQHCGLTISWGAIQHPPGFDDRTPCPCDSEDTRRKAVEDLAGVL